MRKYTYVLILILLIIISCTTSKKAVNTPENNKAIHGDTIRIANEELEYEVIIIDPGFTSWLVSRAFPRGYHSQTFLENKNRMYITEWNSRVLQPNRFSPNLYEMTINYDYTVNYGYEVNYLIYNYMIYFQNTNNQRLFGNVPSR
ncbi:DUF6146 family protein [Flavobacterium sp.]|uniref:DUF6146 family protein n=1 Tax=Flavobacterium sp. TaxID=239 RepID=UPI002631BFD4|nr:DUF6146 family protein [Flavobacterium sp.]MDG2433734.1 DUF6146 family protein [Flavobacterium sp.]